MAKKRKKPEVPPKSVPLRPMLAELAGLIRQVKGKDPKLYLAFTKFHQRHEMLCKAAVIVYCPKPRQ
jgi:hypothetical protein